MGRTRPRRGLNTGALGCIGLLLGLVLGGSAYAQAVDNAIPTTGSVCEQAGRVAERAHALPSGILLAIGRIESGRWDLVRQRIVPWPWAIDANGDGKLFDNKAEAVAQTTALRASGVPNIDVGCFQIDLTSHPDAFRTLEQAFDPFSNADYAGRFLATLYARTGAWDSAVAAYHSMQPERGGAYRERVFADWASRDVSLEALGASLTKPAPGPLVVQFSSGARMRIWTPDSAAVTPTMDTGQAPVVRPLPHVIIGTPNQR